MTPATFTYNDIPVGHKFQFTHTFTEEDGRQFAQLTGSPFSPTVPRFLLASLISTAFGMHIVGERCLLVSTNLTFIKDVEYGQPVIVASEALTKSDAIQLINFGTEVWIKNRNNPALSASVAVKVMEVLTDKDDK